MPREEILRRLADGQSVADLADEMRCGRHVIEYRLRQWNAPRYHGGTCWHRDPVRARAERLRKAGVSATVAAIVLDRSHRTVAKWYLLDPNPAPPLSVTMRDVKADPKEAARKVRELEHGLAAPHSR